jgi:hypothetical protein
MNNFEHTLYDSMVHNSLLFLENGVRILIQSNNENIRDKIILSCSNIQISLELAMRAFILQERGIQSIVDKKHQNSPIDELEKLFNDRKLKVLEFEALKNQLKGQEFKKQLKDGKMVALFAKEDMDVIDDFQTYRNKLVHFCCHLEDDTLEDLQNRLLYYVVRIVLCLLYNNFEDKNPAEYFQQLLGFNFYNLLWNSEGYEKAIMKLVSERTNNVGTCLICNRKTYDIDEEICYFCNFNLEEACSRTDCLICDGHNTVVYDKLNIHNPGNHHLSNCFCQHCERQHEIFECPICKQIHWTYFDEEKWSCYDGHCVTKNIDYPIDD